jgi:uncharacterized protein YjdB
VKVSGTTITALKAGQVTLMARAGAGESVRQSMLALTVADAAFSALAINLPEGNTGTVAVGRTLSLVGVASFGPDIHQTVTRQVLWLSDNPSVAFVDNAAASSGTVSGLSEGTATIKAYYRGQLVASRAITVTP